MKPEIHPYGVFIPSGARGMIVGSFPIGKFTDPARRQEIKKHELDFFFGGERNLLWKLISAARGREINSKIDVVDMLTDLHLGVGDVIHSCRRRNGGAADADLYDITFNTSLLDCIRESNIRTLYFTSRKVESWFNKLFPDTLDLDKISLISPSAQSFRSLGKNAEFQKWRSKHPERPAVEFLYLMYKNIFGVL